MDTYCFGPFELRPNGTLLREGRPLDLSPKQKGLLDILASAGGRIVSKGEILDRLWPDEDVSEASVTTCVRGLRVALDDRGRHGGYLETVHGRGYRFHATVRSAPDRVAKQRMRIAVAPFACDAEGDRYLAEGLAGEVAAGLGRWRDDGLDAIARASAERSWARHRDNFALATELGLDLLVTGRVARRARHVQIDVELTRIAARQVEWSEAFVGAASESGYLAAEIAEALAKRLLTPAAADDPPHAVAPLSTDARAHHALLRGYFLNQYRTEAGLRRSIECFERAIAWDPRCAAAHAALGEAYLNLGYRGFAAPVEIAPLARRVLARALAIDSGSALAHAARAFLAAFIDRDFRTAEEALAVFGGSASAHDRSAWMGGLVHLAAGRCDDALKSFEAGLVLDPLSPNLAIARAQALWMAGRDDEALSAARDLIATESEFPAAHALRADLAAASGLRDEALRSAMIADELGRGDQLTRTACAWAFGQAGRPDAARALLDTYERRARTRYVSPTLMATGYAGVGDHESALRWLARATDARCMWLAFAAFDPRLAQLRDDPRCKSILAEAGLARRDSDGRSGAAPLRRAPDRAAPKRSEPGQDSRAKYRHDPRPA